MQDESVRLDGMLFGGFAAAPVPFGLIQIPPTLSLREQGAYEQMTLTGRSVRPFSLALANSSKTAQQPVQDLTAVVWLRFG